MISLQVRAIVNMIFTSAVTQGVATIFDLYCTAGKEVNSERKARAGN